MKKLTKSVLVLVFATALAFIAKAQSYTTAASGNWTTAANWVNTSGFGTPTPPIDGSHGSGTMTINHSMDIATNYVLGSATMNISATRTVTVNGNMVINGGSNVNVSGTLRVTGNLTLNSTLNILPGGMVIVDGNLIVVSSTYLIVGTTAAGPPYADLLVKQNLIQSGSGDVRVRQNGRVAVYGNVTDSGGGGTVLRLDNGAQMYVNGNVAYTGGGSDVINSNSTSPFGLYVNGTATSTGGGGTMTANKANIATMQSTNPAFTSWVTSLPGSPLPVTLMFFQVSEVKENSVVFVWATASERNFDYFSLESSTDGESFNEVARIAGHGNTTERKDYAYELQNPVVGKTYYRLTSVDFDGYTESFDVVTVKYEAEKSAVVFPNPVVDGNLHLNLNFEPGADVTVTFTSLTGNEVFRQVLDGSENLMILNLEPGTYLVKIVSSEINKVTRIVVK